MSRTAQPVAGHISVADFDPNKSLGSQKFWLTYTGTLMLRRTRGPAISDFNSRSIAKLYEWDPSIPGWALIAYKDPNHPARCDKCGGTTVDYEFEYDYYNAQWEYDYSSDQIDRGRWAFLRRNGRLIDPLQCLYMCQICKRAHG